LQKLVSISEARVHEDYHVPFSAPTDIEDRHVEDKQGDRSLGDGGRFCSVCLQACLLCWQSVSTVQVIRFLLSSIEQHEREEPGQHSQQRTENREPE
jgi:hypothetical protein